MFGKMILLSLLVFITSESHAIPPASPNCSCTYPESFGRGVAIETSSLGGGFKGACSGLSKVPNTDFSAMNGGSLRSFACVDPSWSYWANTSSSCNLALNNLGASQVYYYTDASGCGYGSLSSMGDNSSDGWLDGAGNCVDELGASMGNTGYFPLGTAQPYPACNTAQPILHTEYYNGTTMSALDATIAFSNVGILTSTTYQVAVSNQGPGNATGCNYSLSGANVSNFSIAPTAGDCVSNFGLNGMFMGSINACTLHLKANSATVGSRSANLNINCSNGVSITTPITATFISTSATLVSSSASLNFRATQVGTIGSTVSNLSLSNSSTTYAASGCTATLNNNHVQCTSGPCDGITTFSLPTSGASPVAMSFKATPKYIGPLLTTMNVSCSGGASTSVALNVTGFTPTIASNPASGTTIDFGNVEVGLTDSSATPTNIVMFNVTNYQGTTILPSTCTLTNPSGSVAPFAVDPTAITCVQGFSSPPAPPALMTSTKTCSVPITVTPTSQTVTIINASLSCVTQTIFTSVGLPLADQLVPWGLPITFNLKVTGIPPTICPIEGQSTTTAGNLGTCTCPTNYETVAVAGVSKCRPKLPFSKTRKVSDFFRDSNGYPVCGTGRIPVTANGSALDISSSGVPSSISTFSYSPAANNLGPGASYAFSYATGVSNSPVYLYSKQPMSCACSYLNYPAASTGSSAGFEQTTRKMPSDVFSKINRQTIKSTPDYSPVAFGKTGKDDGRIGTNFNQCGCPNLNEKLVPVNSSLAVNIPQGATCEPDVAPSNRVLVEYDPTLHSAQILNGANEPTDSVGNMLTQVTLPVGNGSLGTQVYKRKIWACSPGYWLNLSSKTCEFTAFRHACGKSGAFVSASAVSGSSTDTTIAGMDALFNKTVNKKLGCCMNAFTKGTWNFKFDCIDNSAAAGDFNTLWTSSDSTADGGQLNAIVLNGANGPSSGFYTIAGARCDEFSEFGGTILKGRIDPRTNTVVTENGTISLPTAASYTTLKTNLNKTTPQSIADRIRCPNLVRAAISAKCGANPALPAVQTTLVDSSNQTRCSTAENVQIHVRVEQVTELVGKPVMKIQDSVLNTNTAGNISVKGLIDTANGGDCPPPTSRVGDQCIAK